MLHYASFFSDEFIDEHREYINFIIEDTISDFFLAVGCYIPIIIMGLLI